MPTRQKVLLMDVLADRYLESLLTLVPAGFELVRITGGGLEEKLEKARDADYLITIGTPVPAAVVQAAKQLKLIQKAGVGYDNIDLAAAAKAGIPVAISAGANAISVAEHVFLMILALYRNLDECRRIAQEGSFVRKWDLVNDSFELFGKTLGIVGLGHVGRQVAKRAKGFGIRTIYFDKYYRPAPGDEESLGVELVPFEDLLKLSDIVTLHVPLKDDTRKMIGLPEFTMMKRSALLINTARGPVVNEAELIEALKSKLIAGAGIDVFDPEPARSDNPLFQFPNVVATPHFAAVVLESEQRCMAHSLENVQRMSEGRPLRHIDVIVATPQLKIEPAPIVW